MIPNCAFFFFTLQYFWQVLVDVLLNLCIKNAKSYFIKFAVKIDFFKTPIRHGRDA